MFVSFETSLNRFLEGMLIVLGIIMSVFAHFSGFRAKLMYSLVFRG